MKGDTRMSHFSVAVFHEEGQSIDELLAPYNEEIEYAPYLRFTKPEAIAHAREDYPYMAGKTDEECYELVSGWYIADRNGNLYTTANPNAKWDWWEIGGRWHNSLRLKDGSFANNAKVGDIDFSVNEEMYKKALRFWDIAVKHKPAESEEEKSIIFFKAEYYLTFFGDRETYARRQAQFSTFAVVHANGIWEEKGKCGWFGMSDESPEAAAEWEDNYYENFIKGNEELYLTIVDCHI